jgi:hypothetical protein
MPILILHQEHGHIAAIKTTTNRTRPTMDVMGIQATPKRAAHSNWITLALNQLV